MRARAWFEVVAEVRSFLVFHFLCDRFATMFRDRCAVPLAELAYVQLGAALATFFESSKRQCVVGKRSAALPANKIGWSHARDLLRRHVVTSSPRHAFTVPADAHPATRSPRARASR